MKTQPTTPSRGAAIRALAWCATLPLFATGLAFAQQQPATQSVPAPSSNDEVVKLEKFEVTGSYLPPAANSVAIPVISVGADAIEKSGTNTDLLEVLRKTVPQFSGNANLGSANANINQGATNGGSQLALRNAQTLVLINGRRVAYSPVAGTGGFQFVDVNMIPIAAIERIEVLPDGASAIYGTDAVAGVVNIILKSDFQGFEVGGRYGFSTNTGHYAERSGYLVGGVSTDRTSMTLSAEWSRIDPIYNWERPYSATTFGTPTFAGSVNSGTNFYYLDPSLNAPTVTPGGLPAATLVANGTYSGPRSAGDQFQFFNLSQYVTQTIGSERQSFTLAVDHKISDSLTAFGDLMYVNTQTFSQINGQPINASIAAGQHGNPFDTTVTARNRFVDHPRQFFADTTGIRGVAGLRGDITSNWSWEAAADYSRIRQDFTNPGVINQANLVAAINSDLINMFAREQAPGAIEQSQAVGTASGSFVSTLSNYDFRVTGHAFELPAGSVDLAVGGEIRRESLSAIADPLSIPDANGNIGWNGGVSLSPFSADRSVKSVFAEVRVPVLKDAPGAHLLELSAAGRHEDYSDTSNPTVPKFTLRYLPFNDEFAIRGTYSRSFSAPTLFSLFGPTGVGFTEAFTLNPAGGGAAIDNFQTNYRLRSNPELDPAKSRNYTAGIVYSPKTLRGFSVSVDYWNIKQTGLVVASGGDTGATILQSVETLGTASPYASIVHFGSFTGSTVTAPGQISTGVPDDIYVDDTLANSALIKLDGFDVSAKYTYNAAGVGRFNFGTNIGIYNHYKVQLLPTDEPEEDAGRTSLKNGTIPRWQSYTTIDFTQGAYGAFVGWRSIPSLTDREDGTHVGGFNSFDAAVSYTFGPGIRYLSGAKLTLGCNNLFNRFGPQDPTVFSDSNVDTSTYGAIGRFLYVDVKYKF
jgi:iron complex outermembrane receptor protein